MIATLAHTNGSAAKLQNWGQQSVRDYFSSFNWEDKPPEIQQLTVQSLQGGNTPLSFTLTVKEFFGAIPWDGVAIAAPTPVSELLIPEAEPPKPSSFTLDDFSSLF